MELVGETVYANGTTILDVSNTGLDPLSTTLIPAVGAIPYPFNARPLDSELRGSDLFFGGAYGAVVMDVSDPLNPVVTGSRSLPVVNRIAVEPGYLYATDDDQSKLYILPILEGDANRLGPAAEFSLESAGCSMPRPLDVLSNYAYIGCVMSGNVLVLDVSSPQTPAVVETLAFSGRPGEVQVSPGGTHLFVMDDLTLQVFSLADPAHPALVDTPSLESAGSRVAFFNGQALVTNSWLGLQILDISQMDSIHKTGEFGVPGDSLRVEVVGNTAYSALGGATAVLDISDKRFPRTNKILGLNGKAMDLAVSGDYLYTADANGGVRVFDIADPFNPRETGYLQEVMSSPYGIQAAGEHLFLADGYLGLVIYDISDPASPQKLSIFQMSRTSHDPLHFHEVHLRGNVAYCLVSDGYDYYGLEIVDVSDPSHPASLYSTALPGYPQHMSVGERYLYIPTQTSGVGGILIYDVADPAAPLEAGSIATNSAASASRLVGSLLYTVCGNDGLIIYDVSDLENVQVKAVYPGLYARDVTVLGELALLSSYTGIYLVQGPGVDVLPAGQFVAAADDRINTDDAWQILAASAEGGARLSCRGQDLQASTSTRRAEAAMKVFGRGLTLTFDRGPQFGSLDVLVDWKRAARINQYAASPGRGATQHIDLPPGGHLVVLRNVSHAQVNLDSLYVDPVSVFLPMVRR